MNMYEDLSNAQVLRKNAEEKLDLTENRTTVSVIEADVKRLVHELQVHQIELEMQNDELRLANERAEAALKNYTLMYDFAPMGYFILNQNGKICELNFTGAEILGDKRYKLLNSNFKLFVSDETLPVFTNFLNTVYLDKSKESCEVLLGSNAEHLCHVYLEASVTGDEDKCLLSVVNISKFKK